MRLKELVARRDARQPKPQNNFPFLVSLNLFIVLLINSDIIEKNKRKKTNRSLLLTRKGSDSNVLPCLDSWVGKCLTRKNIFKWSESKAIQWETAPKIWQLQAAQLSLTFSLNNYLGTMLWLEQGLPSFSSWKEPDWIITWVVIRLLFLLYVLHLLS